MIKTGNQPFIYSRDRTDHFCESRSTDQFKSLDDYSLERPLNGEFAKHRICIVSQELGQTSLDTELGRSQAQLAFSLADAGHDVVLLYPYFDLSDQEKYDAEEFYLDGGVTFSSVISPVSPIQLGEMGKVMQPMYVVYEWFKEQVEFDSIHAPDTEALLFFCILAKQAGLHFLDTKFIVMCFGGTLWRKTASATPITDVFDISYMHMERRCAELADLVVSPNQYMNRWMLDQSYQLNQSHCVTQPLALLSKPTIYNSGSQSVNESLRRIHELVFVGELSPKDGVHFFLDALVQLYNRGSVTAETMPSVTLFGEPVAYYDIDQQIANVELKLGVEISLFSNHSSLQGIEYVAAGKARLAVFPAMVANSSANIFDALINEVPFISSSAGGSAELIHSDDIEFCVFEPRPYLLVEKLQKVLCDGALVPKAARNLLRLNESWLNYYQQCDKAAGEERSEYLVDGDALGGSPLVSVCMAHHNRGQLLLNAIESLQGQSYRNVEVVIVDDGSSDPDALSTLKQVEQTEYDIPVRVVYQPNQYLGAVRNTGVEYSNGDYILFMDDDNEAKPKEIETFLAVANRTQADILTCWSTSFSGERPGDGGSTSRTIAFQGPNLALGLVENGYGDSNCFVRRDAINKLNGFSEHYKVGLDDVEFFSRAVLSGMKLVVIPQTLYWYRINTQRMRSFHYSKFSGSLRVSEPYCQGLHPDLANLLRYAQGLTNKANIEENGSMNKVDQVKNLLNRAPALRRLVKRIYLAFKRSI